MTNRDKTIENLFELDGIKYVVEETLGLWVKFEAKPIPITEKMPHGVKYSLTLQTKALLTSILMLEGY